MVRATENLIKARAEKILTIKELEGKANVPMATISRAENRKTLSVKSAGKLCKVLDKAFEELFVIEDKGEQ